MAAAIAKQPHNLPLLATTETCSGGTYIVTGANTGLGFETAKHLVAVGAAKVILAVRNLSAGERAKTEIEGVTGTSNVALVWVLDLASYDSVKAFAKRAVTELDRIDALIENAGVASYQRVMAEGHLVDVTVNVLSTLLLGVLLLPKMSESGQRFGILPHLVVVTTNFSFDSEAEWNKIKDDPLVKMDDEAMPVMETCVAYKYALSKLLEIMTVRHLASLIPVSRTGVVVNLVCPGFCKTDLMRNGQPAFREYLTNLHQQFGRTAEDGSRPLLHAAVAGKQSHGCFLQSCKTDEDALPSWITDEEGKKSQKVVWEIIANELESVEPGCVKNVL